MKLKRWYHDDCTIGRLTLGDFQCFTLELPDKNNQTDISCIPESEYKCKTHLSTRRGSLVVAILDVWGREHIQIHSGNYTSQILGCILVGDSVKWLNSDNIPDVTNSKKTLRKLIELIGLTPTTIDIWS